DVRVHHFGYLGVVRDSKGKASRNLELLQRQAAEGDDTPFLHFNLGAEYLAVGDDAAALREFETSWEKLRSWDGSITKLGFVPSLSARYVRALHLNDRHDEMERLVDEVLGMFPDFTDVVLELAVSASARGKADEAERLFRRCLDMGDAPSRYSSAIGAGTYLARLGLAELLRKLGRLEEAEAEVRYCLEHHSTFIGVVEPYASVRLATGADPADVVAEVHAAMDDMPPGARFMLAVTLHEAGAAQLAEAELREVVATHPHSGPALLALGEALLSQARFAEVVELLEAVEADSPWAPHAVRAGAFAALAAGDAQTAGELLARPAVERLTAAERGLLRAWQAAVAGATPPESLPGDAAGPALVMLEALARVEAFDAFELLAGRYDTLDLPWRERREKLAEVYLRRGFLESAADEWIAVADAEGADASVLLGLAQVAWARGMDEDAVVFAQEARELEPGHAGAARLLEHLGAAA
ncbi:MAG TPA: hypothetical protein VHF89_04150, partial [Solirubrobacteraceae bacterium]|nr:hypothetical protein [Solirubrobacteraceae bacterium]